MSDFIDLQQDDLLEVSLYSMIHPGDIDNVLDAHHQARINFYAHFWRIFQNLIIRVGKMKYLLNEFLNWLWKSYLKNNSQQRFTIGGYNDRRVIFGANRPYP